MSAATAHEPLTRSVEDYLKAIYHLSHKGQPATTSEIAQWLDLTPPSVSGMVKRLSEQGLLEHVPYKGVELTPTGRRLALQMLRRHRIIETYLVAFLGFTWDNVHPEAERLEHAVSDTLIDRMAAALGNPRVDPHGDPIPAADGSVEELIYTALPDCEVGRDVSIVRVESGDPERLRYLASLGLTPGTRASVIAQAPFEGPVTVRVAGREHVIGHELARLLLCEGPDAA